MIKLFTFMLCMLLLLQPALADKTEAEHTVVQPQWEVPAYVTLLLEVAGDEIGYTEDRYGNTKYGEWAGDPDAQWCAEFMCWCVDQVDQRHGTALLHNVYPLYSGQNGGKRWFIQQGRYIVRDGYLNDWGYQWMLGSDQYNRNGTYIPQPGDWVFFTWTNDDDTDHVAMVEYVTVDQEGAYYVHVIEGNNPDCVQRKTYSIKDDRILGYGAVHDVCGWTMRRGNTGVQVDELQEKLVALGYLDPQYATGTYGPSTVRAVAEIQDLAGINDNGRADMETQALIDEMYRTSVLLPAEESNGGQSLAANEGEE